MNKTSSGLQSYKRAIIFFSREKPKQKQKVRLNDGAISRLFELSGGLQSGFSSLSERKSPETF